MPLERYHFTHHMYRVKYTVAFCSAKEYDQDLRGFVYVMEGGSTVTRMQLPKSDRQHCELLITLFNVC